METGKPDAGSIFGEALRLSVPSERKAYLDRTCAGDKELRQEVESLLSAYDLAGGFLDPTCKSPEPDFVLERTGAMIGRYKLLETIGEGGFGMVYLAEQTEPVQRKVALKIIKPGMDTREVVARFEAERQALALMDHPNIAKVLDGGATEAGRPYFVMELVRGIPITDYCDQNHLSTADRLGLFISVCRALQHAHQKGLIHRDLKPSNVLVTLQDGAPVPKVIDFGIAKALGQRLTDKTLFTGYRQMIGTPAYMSPEQAELSGVDVDTRSDIYSLGVLLYELLTGVTPFDRETLAKAALDEIRRMIRETEPARPSTRLQTLGEKLPEVAKRRRTEPATLNRLIRGDLDWIVMKCLEKDRTRRYGTANELGLDISRHLNREPVSAVAPSWVYLATKFVYRHRTALAMAAALVLLMAAGTTGSLIEAARALKAEREQVRLREEAQKARQEESVQRQKATALARESLERLVVLNSGNGARLLEQGDYTALPWFIEALKINHSLRDDRPHRLRLGSVLRQAPRPVAMWFHEGPVRNVEFSPDGRWALSCGDARVCVWSVETGRALIPPITHPSVVSSACFNPSGTLALSTAGELWIWNPQSGAVLHRLHPGAFFGTFSGDGKLVASAGADRAVRVWSLEDGKEVLPPILHSGSLRECVFSPDNRLLATFPLGSVGEVWDLLEKRKLYEFSVSHSLRCVAFSPDAKILAAGDWANAVYRWNALTGERLGQPLPHNGLVEDLRFTSDASLLASCSLDGIVKLWEPASGALVRSLPHPGFGMSARFSQDNTRLLARTFDGRLHLWDVATGNPKLFPIRHTGWVRCAALHPEGQLALAGCSDGSVRLWDLQPEGARFWPWPGQTRRILNASHDGGLVVSHDQAGVVSLWNTETWQSHGKPIPVQGVVRTAFLNRDASRLLIVQEIQGAASSPQLCFALHDSRTGETISKCGTMDLSGPVTRVTASLDCQKIALARAVVCELRDTQTGQLIGKPASHATPITVQRFSPDGANLAFNCGRLLHVLETTGAGTPFNLTNNQATSSADFSPDGAFLASAGSSDSYEPGEAFVADSRNRTEVRRFRSTDGVRTVAFNKHSTWLAMGGENNTARVWDFRTGQPITPILQHTKAVIQLAFSPDDRLLASVTGDGAVYVWDVATGEIITPALGRDQGATEVRFLAGSRYLLTNGREGWRLWKLQPAEAPVEDLANLAYLFASHRIDPTGTLEPLPAELQGRLYEDLRVRYPEFFAPSPRPEQQVDTVPSPRPSMAIPARPAEATPEMVDLTEQFHAALAETWHPGDAGNDLARLPAGVQQIRGVQFDLRGIVQLNGGGMIDNQVQNYPRRVQGIKVGRKCTRLHFLHATGWAVRDGTVIGEYVLHYADGSHSKLPIVYGVDVRDWWVGSDRIGELENAQVAWHGQTSRGNAVRIYKRTWENPNPDRQVASIEFVSTMTSSAPFLLAITTEP